MVQHRIYDKPTLRLIVEAMLYRMPVETCQQNFDAGIQFNRWSSKAKLMSIFKALVHDLALE
ncbi:MAG: hypothetical protein CK424_01390 [Legionella sp.]|nr:MAG: hypothetical protein CK424_01390 [Legionella sp.]